MDDLNPYESPKVARPRASMAKRGLGVGLILLFTPPAMVIAVLTCCTAAGNMTSSGLSGGMGMIFGVPLAILAALMVWAAILDRPRQGDSNQTPVRTGYFLATPLVVLGACGLGYGLALLAAFPFSTEQSFFGVGIFMAFGVFWLTPLVALIVMLWLAWRVK